MTIHLLQLVLFPLSALAIASTVRGRWGLAAQIVLGIFAVAYVAFDTFAGLATSAVAEAADSGGAFAKALLQSPVNTALFLIGTTAWLAGSVLTAAAWWRAGSGVVAGVPLVAAGFLLFLDHPAPWGPVTFGLAAVALAMHATRAGAADQRPSG